jgi:hypothetical protein
MNNMIWGILLIYCAISFNSARVVTRDPKHRFGTLATNKVWCDTCKISPFLHLRGRFGPDVTHFTFGTRRCDPWPRPKFIAAQGVLDAWLPNWMKLCSTSNIWHILNNLVSLLCSSVLGAVLGNCTLFDREYCFFCCIQGCSIYHPTTPLDIIWGCK